MPDEIVPQPAQAGSAESAPAEPTTESQLPESTQKAEAAVTAESAPAPTELQNTEDEGAGPKETPKVVHELISVRKRAQTAEEKLAQIEAENAYLRQQAEAASLPKRIEKEPDLAEYDDWEKYQKDYTDWTKQQVRDEIVQKDIDKKFYERSAQTASEIPDYRQTLATAQVPITPTMAAALKENEYGPKIFYYLAKNPAEAMKIAYLSPTMASMEIGKIEERVRAAEKAPPPAPKITQAPEPVKPLGSSQTLIEDDLGKLSPAEYAKRRNKELYGR